MSVFQGFVGPSYVSISPNVAKQTLYNWYPQTVEVSEPARQVFMPRPGLVPAFALSDFPVRGAFHQDGRMFMVGGQTLFEVFNNAPIAVRGTLSAKDTKPATINSSGTAGHQLFITSAGKGDIFDLNANVLSPITASGFPSNVTMGTYLDSYFLTNQGNTAQFNISGLLDGTVWNSLDFAVRFAGSDNLMGIIEFNKLIWLIGSQTSEPWYDSGAASFPFAPVPQVLIQVGCCASFSIVRTSQSVCWLHQSERGRGIFVSASDYNPQRISTYAVESQWATYPTITDCVAYAMTWQGHEFLIATFPSGNATWVYDFLERTWTQWSFWNEQNANQDRFRGWVHCQGFGQHYVGDWETGMVYTLDQTVATDNAQPIVWERSTPHLNDQFTRNFYANFQVDMETGLGGSTPTAQLAWSDDGGHTYGQTIPMATGALGDYGSRCRAAGGLGSGRNRIFRFRLSNNVPPRLQQAYLDVTKGTS